MGSLWWVGWVDDDGIIGCIVGHYVGVVVAFADPWLSLVLVGRRHCKTYTWESIEYAWRGLE